MMRTTRELESFVMSACNGDGFLAIYDMHGHWFIHTFQPMLMRYSARVTAPRQRRIAAIGMYLVGDIYDVVYEAPLAAARAYRRAVRLWPRMAAAWRELGSVLHWVGDYSAAKRSLARAAVLDPTDEITAGELNWIRQKNVPPPVSVDTPISRARDAFAKGWWFTAMKLLRHQRDVSAWQLRARIHGAVGDSRQQLEAWDAIARSGKPVRMAYGDWFFLTHANWSAGRFWKTLISLQNRLEDGIYPLASNVKLAPTLKLRRKQFTRAFAKRLRRC